MKQIWLKPLYWRHLIRLGYVSMLYQFPFDSPPFSGEEVLCYLADDQGRKGKTKGLCCFVRYQQKVNPSDESNYWYSLVVQAAAPEQ